MGEAAVLNDITKGKVGQFIEGRSCANCDSNSKTRRELDQKDLDEMLEISQRIKLISRMFWEMEGFDKEELGTASLMLNREADNIFATMENLSARLGA